MVSNGPAAANFLVVDDEPFARTTVVQLLNRLDARTIWQAANGREAIDLLDGDARRAEAAIIDFRMPEMHGLEFLKAVRTGRTAAPRDLKCAMFTGHTERRLIGLALALDVDAILAKPASLDTLRKHIGFMQGSTQPVADVAHYDALDVNRPLLHLLDAATGRETGRDLSPGTLRLVRPQKRPGTSPTGRSGGAGAGRLLPIDTVGEGMVLAEDVVDTGGVLLLSAGTLLSERYITRLREVDMVGGPITHLPIQPAESG